MPYPAAQAAPHPVTQPAAQPVAAPPSQALAAQDDDLESTIVVVRGAAGTLTRWKLVDVDGSEFPLHRSNVLGRKPSTNGAPEGSQAISLSDAERVLSRTHALIEVEGDELWVSDLGSTNGTGILPTVSTHDDDREECPAHQRVRIPSGAAVSLGGRRVFFAASENVQGSQRS